MMFGRGRPRCHLAHVDDVVAGLMLCGARQPSRGERFIIGGGEHPTVAELLALIAAACEVRLRALRLPSAPIRLASRVFRGFRDPRTSRPGFFDRCDFVIAERTYAIDRARRELGFVPRVGLRAGIRATVGWYREQRML